MRSITEAALLLATALTSLFYFLSPMSAFAPGWIHYSVTIADPHSTVLPWAGVAPVPKMPFESDDYP